jgi:N-acetylglucosaminyldiphosphoundecaprenol N-acetyl-beta-D-mannosaminyltransferase
VHSDHHRSHPVIIDGVAVNVLNENELLRSIITRARAGVGFTLATLNLDHLVKRRHNAAFRAAYARMTLVTADGSPIVALGRRQAPNLQRATGADLVKPLCAQAAKEGIPIYLFGSTANSLDLAARRLKDLCPDLIICGQEAPPQGFDPMSAEAEACGARIAASGARLCFVCLGAPKQEFFADRMTRLHPGVGFMCVGAALDFIADAQIRAPGFMRKAGMEWIWRILSHPRRMAWRYVQCASLLAEITVIEPLWRRLGLKSEFGH